MWECEWRSKCENGSRGWTMSGRMRSGGGERWVRVQERTLGGEHVDECNNEGCARGGCE